VQGAAFELAEARLGDESVGHGSLLTIKGFFNS